MNIHAYTRADIHIHEHAYLNEHNDTNNAHAPEKKLNDTDQTLAYDIAYIKIE